METRWNGCIDWGDAQDECNYGSLWFDDWLDILDHVVAEGWSGSPPGLAMKYPGSFLRAVHFADKRGIEAK